MPECQHCHKELVGFRPNTKWCSKLCRSRAYHDIHPKRAREYRSTMSGRIAALLNYARTRARLYGRECSLAQQDIVIPPVCPVFKVPFDFAATRDSRTYAPSLDRIDNNKGYVAGNVRVISFRANVLKRDATVKELEAVLQYMKGTDVPCIRS